MLNADSICQYDVSNNNLRTRKIINEVTAGDAMYRIVSTFYLDVVVCVGRCP